MSPLLLIALPATRVAYVLLALLIGGESAGIPLPGETALITGSILASQGKLWLPLVIAVAAAAAIVGDNIGYELGRHGARRLLSRPGRFEDRRQAFLERGEAFFARHGGRVLFGRWLPFRVTARLAGPMPWRASSPERARGSRGLRFVGSSAISRERVSSTARAYVELR
jgi:undecaprenyl-diphosphatase